MISNQYRGGGGSPLGGNMTPLVKKVLGLLIVLYVIQVFALKPQSITPIAPHGLAWLYLWDLGSGFWRPWQPFTAFLFNRGVMAAALDWLMVFFFLGSVEQLVGTKRLGKGMLWTALVAILFAHSAMALTHLLDPGAVGPSIAFRGLEPFLISLLVIFGLAQPNAQILLCALGVHYLYHHDHGTDPGRLAGWLCLCPLRIWEYQSPFRALSTPAQKEKTPKRAV
jgi:membrane associated rhomboid family serine protease